MSAGDKRCPWLLATICSVFLGLVLLIIGFNLRHDFEGLTCQLDTQVASHQTCSVTCPNARDADQACQGKKYFYLAKILRDGPGDWCNDHWVKYEGECQGGVDDARPWVPGTTFTCFVRAQDCADRCAGGPSADCADFKRKDPGEAGFTAIGLVCCIVGITIIFFPCLWACIRGVKIICNDTRHTNNVLVHQPNYISNDLMEVSPDMTIGMDQKTPDKERDNSLSDLARTYSYNRGSTSSPTTVDVNASTYNTIEITPTNSSILLQGHRVATPQQMSSGSSFPRRKMGSLNRVTLESKNNKQHLLLGDKKRSTVVITSEVDIASSHGLNTPPPPPPIRPMEQPLKSALAASSSPHRTRSASMTVRNKPDDGSIVLEPPKRMKPRLPSLVVPKFSSREGRSPSPLSPKSLRRQSMPSTKLAPLTSSPSRERRSTMALPRDRRDSQKGLSPSPPQILCRACGGGDKFIFTTCGHRLCGSCASRV